MSNRRAYRLEFPATMSRMHPIISITHLALAVNQADDSFGRENA